MKVLAEAMEGLISETLGEQKVINLKEGVYNVHQEKIRNEAS